MNKKAIVSILLAITLVVGGFNGMDAMAAAKIMLKNGKAAPSTIYAGNTYELKVSDAKEKVTFSSDDKKVATIEKTTGKLTAKAPGTVKITAKNAKSKKKIATATFKVLQRAKSITTTNKTVNLGAVGDTAVIKAQKAPKTSTDVVRFYSSNKKIVSVGETNGKITAKAEGTATITVYAMETKNTSLDNKNNKLTKVTVQVGPRLESAKQVSLNQVQVTFEAAMKKIMATSFQLKDGSGAGINVKSVEKVNDKTYILTLNKEFTDNTTYTVNYLGKTNATFTAFCGKEITKIGVALTTIRVDTPTEPIVCGYNKEGVIVYERPLSSLDSDWEYTLTTKPSGEVKGTLITFKKKTDTATLTVTHHTNKFENGKEIGAVKKTFTIKAKAKTESYSSELTESDDNGSDTGRIYTKRLCEGDIITAHLNLFDQKQEKLNDATGYTVSSSDESILKVTNNGNLSITMEGMHEGEANLVVKNKDGNTVSTIKITVFEKRHMDSISVDKDSVAVTSGEKETTSETITITKVVDQYGDFYDYDSKDLSVENVDSSLYTTSVSEDKITITAATGVKEEKVVQTNIVLGTVKKPITITVKAMAAPSPTPSNTPEPSQTPDTGYDYWSPVTPAPALRTVSLATGSGFYIRNAKVTIESKSNSTKKELGVMENISDVDAATGVTVAKGKTVKVKVEAVDVSESEKYLIPDNTSDWLKITGNDGNAKATIGTPVRTNDRKTWTCEISNVTADIQLEMKVEAKKACKVTFKESENLTEENTIPSDPDPTPGDQYVHNASLQVTSTGTAIAENNTPIIKIDNDGNDAYARGWILPGHTMMVATGDSIVVTVVANENYTIEEICNWISIADNEDNKRATVGAPTVDADKKKWTCVISDIKDDIEIHASITNGLYSTVD